MSVFVDRVIFMHVCCMQTCRIRTLECRTRLHHADEFSSTFLFDLLLHGY
jgi:hypothetical protein